MWQNSEVPGGMGKRKQTFLEPWDIKQTFMVVWEKGSRRSMRPRAKCRHSWWYGRKEADVPGALGYKAVSQSNGFLGMSCISRGAKFSNKPEALKKTFLGVWKRELTFQVV